MNDERLTSVAVIEPLFNFAFAFAYIFSLLPLSLPSFSLSRFSRPRTLSQKFAATSKIALAQFQTRSQLPTAAHRHSRSLSSLFLLTYIHPYPPDGFALAP
jgi:hypothetical protein